MLNHNKKIAIVLAFVFCMSFLVPAFITPSPAEAAFTAMVVQSNIVPADLDQNLGYFKVEVNVADWIAPGVADSELLVSYPSGIGNATNPNNGTVAVGDTLALGSTGIGIVVPADADNAFTTASFEQPVLGQNGSFLITLTNTFETANEEGWFYVHFGKMNTTNYSGGVNVTLVPQSGHAFGTTPCSLVVGEVNASGSSTAFTATVAQSHYVPDDVNQDLGYFKVEVSVADWTDPEVADSELLVSYPSGIGNATNPNNGTVAVGDTLALGSTGIGIVVPADAGNAFTTASFEQPVLGQNGSFVITLTNTFETANEEGWFYVHFGKMNTTDYSGDVNINLVPKSGTAFGTVPIPLKVGKVIVSSGTTTTATIVQGNIVPAAVDQNLGYFKVEVNVTDWTAPGVADSQLLVSYPTRIGNATNPNDGTVAVGDTVALGSTGIGIVVPADADNAFTTASFEQPVTGKSGAFVITLTNIFADKDKGWFYVHFGKMNTTNYSGEVNVNLVPQTGTAFGCSAISLALGNVIASSGCSTINATVIQSNTVPTATNQNLGYFKVEVNAADWTVPGLADSQLLVSYPTGIGNATNPDNGTVIVGDTLALGSTGIGIVVPADADNAFTTASFEQPVMGQNGSFVITLTNAFETANEKGWFYVHFGKMNTTNYSGAVNVDLVPQSGQVFGSSSILLTCGVVTSDSDNCFIATASFGSKFEPSVVLLRQFRDQYLLTNYLGRSFVEIYYKNSPPIAAFIANDEGLKMVVRGILTPIVGVVYLLLHPKLFYLLIVLTVLLWGVRRRKNHLIDKG